MTGATAQLAEWLIAARAAALPHDVRHEALRCFGHFVGCALAGGRHDVARGIERALVPLSGPALSSLIGRDRRVDPLLAALFNGAAASAHSFDDTHARAIVHPGAPVAAAALATAQAQARSGAELLRATALGVEVTCRASVAISVPPAKADIAWYQTGVTGGLGAAVAAGTLLDLDAGSMRNAIGIAAAQASGSRITQGGMTMLMLAGHAAQSGVRAALLAREGVDSPAASLEGRYGFTDVFSPSPHSAALTDGLGERFEILDNTYKTYPCGVVLHPVVDGCFEIRSRHVLPVDAIRSIRVHLSPTALTLTDRRHPATRTEGQVSVHHWCAVALGLGRAGLPEGEMAMLADPALAALRDRVQPAAEPSYAHDEAEVVVELDDGSTLRSSRHRGVAPMDDAALEAKLRAQAGLVHDAARVDALVSAIAGLPAARDLAALAAVL